MNENTAKTPITGKAADSLNMYPHGHGTPLRAPIEH